MLKQIIDFQAVDGLLLFSRLVPQALFFRFSIARNKGFKGKVQYFISLYRSIRFIHFE